MNINNSSLDTLLEKNRPLAQNGNVAQYIPELKKRDAMQLGVYIESGGAAPLCSGDWLSRFTIQSIVKVPVFMCALMDNPLGRLTEKINLSPTSEPFNSIVNLETKSDKKPLNPMINSGAMVCISLVAGDTYESKMERVIRFISCAIGRSDVLVDRDVYLSELETGDRNRALAYYMKSTGVLDTDIEPLLETYFKLCSLLVDCRDIARLGFLLASRGVTFDGRRLADERKCKIAKAVMATCGLYDGSGDFAVDVGIPAKSGVGGGIMGAVPNKCGVGVFGPSLDRQGNSIAGKKLLSDLSDELSWSIFN